MEQTNFRKLLYRTAFCAMACDGVVDRREVEELKMLDTDTAYFNDIDLSSELESLITEIRLKGKELVKGLFNDLSDWKMNWVQELLLLEISLRIIAADDHYDPVELRFLKSLRSCLSVPDELIIDRFGRLPALGGGRGEELRTSTDEVEFEIPQFPELKNIDLSGLE